MTRPDQAAKPPTKAPTAKSMQVMPMEAVVPIQPAMPSSQQDRRDPENPQAYILTLDRKEKVYQKCKTWKLTVNGEEVGKLPNGGRLVVQGLVGDLLELSVGMGNYNTKCKTNLNTFEFVIEHPGHRYLKLKQVGDVTYWIFIAVFLISMLIMAAGFLEGSLPLILEVVGGCAVYKYGKAKWCEITPCDSDNDDLESGAIVHVTTRGCCCR